ncbi:helix-turn-helix transcriptional regulator [Phaeodactylibacter luteus]|uniref:Response regulator transcription factor n=1 Tax=Phaeodactylibacter luteus TaxID=1564516 RepID=A0A5C6RMF3_9BACT|nr:response regulator transcription factor [Phaeodactylibacter luteus]TXB63568.1 response regulator transcription factor [Phaeodactylibacter luteus]
MLKLGIIDDDFNLLQDLKAFLEYFDELKCLVAESCIFNFLNKSLVPIDLLLLDIELGNNENALDYVDAIHERYEEKGYASPKILILSGHKDQHIYSRSITQKGVQGFFQKGSNPDLLIRAIHIVMAGGFFLSNEPASQIKTLLQQSAPDKQHARADQLIAQHGLNEREVEAARWLIQGLTYEEVGEKMFLSVNTIRHYVRVLYKKLNVNNKTQLRNKLEPLRAPKQSAEAYNP